jgi:1,4-alpha-glucan branching enzyme
MPVADFPGARNCRSDGLLPFAPDSRYGRSADLKALVDAAHARGLLVFLDVVNNHFGPAGDYLHRYVPPFFKERPHIHMITCRRDAETQRKHQENQSRVLRLFASRTDQAEIPLVRVFSGRSDPP